MLPEAIGTLPNSTNNSSNGHSNASSMIALVSLKLWTGAALVSFSNWSVNEAGNKSYLVLPHWPHLINAGPAAYPLCYEKWTLVYRNADELITLPPWSCVICYTTNPAFALNRSKIMAMSVSRERISTAALMILVQVLSLKYTLFGRLIFK